MNNNDWEHFKKTVNPLKDQKKIIRKQYKTLDTTKKENTNEEIDLMDIKVSESWGALEKNILRKIQKKRIRISASLDLHGNNITDLPVYIRSKNGLGYLPQESSIFRGMTVEQNIKSVLQIVEKESEKIELMLDDLLAEFSISHLRKASAITLSGGERRRVEIARCIASNPTHLLLDEPFSGIDPIAIQDLKNLIGYLKQRKIGILITDHNVKDTLDIVDRAYVLYDGKILLKGNPFEIKNDQKVKSVYLGKSFSM